VTATITSWLILPGAPTYDVPAHGASAAAIAWAIGFGPVAGVAAALYTKAIAWADTLRPKGWPRLAMPVVVLAALGCVAIAFPQLLGNGKDVAQRAFLGEMALPLLALLVVMKPLATAACLGSGTPGGLFTPTLTFGALLGGLLGAVWNLWLPGVSGGLAAVVGAAAVWAAASQGPVSALVMMSELTWRSGPSIVPQLLAVGGAVFVARRIEPRSIYSARVHAGRGDEASGKAPSRAA
ncbi:MAG TPA: chloride channel protein, partial [Stellaceae bacterium]|nr:chloride channel protein [Stellaceae bacterium]